MEVEVNDATTDLDSNLDSVGSLKVENSNEESEVSLISETDYESATNTTTSDDDLVIESLNGSDTDSNNSAAYDADVVNSPDNGESEANQDDDTNPNGGVNDNFNSALDSTAPTSSPDTVASADFTSTNTATLPLPPTLPFLGSGFNPSDNYDSANHTGSAETTSGNDTESSDTDNVEEAATSINTIDTDTNEPINIILSGDTKKQHLANSGLVTITSLLTTVPHSNNIGTEYVTPTVSPDKANDQKQQVQEEESQSQSSHSVDGPGELRWLIPGELMQPSLALLWGESKTGKTFVALHYALNTALTLLPPTSPSSSSITTTAGSNTTQQPLLRPCVIYVVGDDQRSVAFASIVRRVRAWCAEQESALIGQTGEASSFNPAHLAEHFFIWPGSLQSAVRDGNTSDGEERSGNIQQHTQVFADQLKQAGLQPVLIVIDEPPQARLRDRAAYRRSVSEAEAEIASWFDLEERCGACVLAVKNASPELNKTFPFFNTILTTTITTLNPEPLDGGSSRASSRQELELHCQSQQEAAPFDPYQLRWGWGTDVRAGSGTGTAGVTESPSLSLSSSVSVLHLDRGNSFGKATPSSSSSKKLTTLVSKPEPASSSSTSVPDLSKPSSVKVKEKELVKTSAELALSPLPAQPLVTGESESENEREGDSIISDIKSGADGVGNTNPLSVNSSEMVILQHLQQATLTPSGGLKSSELVGQVGSALSRRSVFRVIGNLKTKGLITKGEEPDALYYISEAGLAELLLLPTANTTQAG